ncbi:global transactivator [Fusarium flagelliforme]|uniref:Global transactivator n=1 Tax=Fusarium flagelliforme TaxID=2675880 RepID=A0A395MN91_9HYPO|nr:global transactivator [Fusarium flagelliforme]
MTRFNAAEGARVLLASRATGGQGLNLQSANAPIRCGPWWKVSWEQQAEGKIHWYGQQKPTYIYGLFDEASDIVNCLRSLRDKKNRINSQILEAITHEDDRGHRRDGLTDSSRNKSLQI